MKKTKITLWISLLFFGLFFVFTHDANAEVIREFSSTINVLPDSSIFVKEQITYDFEDVIRHGIIRTIPLYNSKKEPLKIEVISVINEFDKSYEFNTDSTNNSFSIKIGDTDRMVSGIKEYIISYRVLGSITYYENFDELYWNATGNDWQVKILKSEVKVILPNNVFSIQQSCYYGKLNSIKNCYLSDTNTFFSGDILNEKEGLTVAVGFPKGIVSVYKSQIVKENSKPFEIFWPIIIPTVVFIFMFINWYKKGRDEKGTGVIVPQYDVFENLTPLEVGGIMNGRIDNQDISAEIIYLATKGYLKIKQIDETCDNFLCLISKKDYEFTLLKEMGLLTNSFDKKIMRAIFDENGKVGGVSKLSELNNKFYKSITSISNAVSETLLKKEYYTNFPKSKNNKDNLIFTIFILGISIFASQFYISDNNLDLLKKILIFTTSILLSVLIRYIFNRLMTAKSHKGARAHEYFLGLKEYLQIAEKDRLNFHNDPGKKPETFEVLLPYAMVFNVEELWAKEFKDIYNIEPKWYESKSSSFNVIKFGHEMAMFSSLANISISTSPSNSGSGGFSSGSGGGGFSGGGGGGGGGGSW